MNFQQTLLAPKANFEIVTILFNYESTGIANIYKFSVILQGSPLDKIIERVNAHKYKKILQQLYINKKKIKNKNLISEELKY